MYFFVSLLNQSFKYTKEAAQTLTPTWFYTDATQSCDKGQLESSFFYVLMLYPKATAVFALLKTLLNYYYYYNYYYRLFCF